MRNIFNKSKYFFLAAVCVMGFAACVDLEFDQPEITGLCGSDLTADITIAELRALVATSPSFIIQDSLVLSGVVSADDELGNFYRRIVVQDETAGIQIEFGETSVFNRFPIGSEVYILCAGLTLTNDGGLIQLEGIESALLDNIICKGSENLEVAPLVATIDELSSVNYSTLVTITNVKFDDVSVNQGLYFADVNNLQPNFDVKLVSCDNDQIQIEVFTSQYSAFAGELIPSEAGSITGIYSVYSGDPQFLIIDPADINFTEDRCGNVDYKVVDSVDEDFDATSSNNNDISIDGWGSIVSQGNRVWRGKEFSENVYAQATAFGDSQELMETWLVTPGVYLDNQMVLNFDSQVGFPVAGHDGLKVYYSTDYSGPFSFASSTWIELSGNISDSNSDSFNWLNSGDILLPVLDGKTAVVAFEYKGSGENGNNQTSTYGIDNVKIQAQ